MMKQMFLAGVVGLASSSAAVAGPFYMELGQDFSGDGSTRTADYNALGSTNTLATSIYLGDSIGPGTQIIDSNRDSVLTEYGVPVDGISLPNRNQKNVSALNPSPDQPASDNGFVPNPGGWDSGDFWGLTFEYTLFGEVTSDDSFQFNNGSFDLFYENAGNRLQVLSIDVTGSNLQAANLDLFGEVNFDFADATDDFVQNFFVDSNSGETFYDLVASGTPIPIHWILDTNVNPPVPTEDQLVESQDSEGNTVLIRQTDLNTSQRFVVPEPSAVMLLGLGLLGLAFVAHRRRKSDSGFAA